MFVLGVITLGAGLRWFSRTISGRARTGGDRYPRRLVNVDQGPVLLVPAAPRGNGFFLKELHFDQLFYLYMAIPLVLGIYLTYGGFTSKAHS